MFFFIDLSCSLPFCLLLLSISLLSIGWYCGAGVFGLIGCKSRMDTALDCCRLLIIIISLFSILLKHYVKSY